MGIDETRALMAKCRKLAACKTNNKQVLELIEETLSIIAGVIARQERQSNQINRLAEHGGLNKKYL